MRKAKTGRGGRAGRPHILGKPAGERRTGEKPAGRKEIDLTIAETRRPSIAGAWQKNKKEKKR